MSELSERLTEAAEAEIVNAPWKNGDVDFPQAARGAVVAVLRELRREWIDKPGFREELDETDALADEIEAAE